MDSLALSDQMVQVVTYYSQNQSKRAVRKNFHTWYQMIRPACTTIRRWVTHIGNLQKVKNRGGWRRPPVFEPTAQLVSSYFSQHLTKVPAKCSCIFRDSLLHNTEHAKIASSYACVQDNLHISYSYNIMLNELLYPIWYRQQIFKILFLKSGPFLWWIRLHVTWFANTQNTLVWALKTKGDSRTWSTQRNSDSLVHRARQCCNGSILLYYWNSRGSRLWSNAGNLCPVRATTIPTERCFSAGRSFYSHYMHLPFSFR